MIAKGERKLWAYLAALAALGGGAFAAVKSPAFAAVFSSYVGGVVGALTVFAAGNVGTHFAQREPAGEAK